MVRCIYKEVSSGSREAVVCVEQAHHPIGQQITGPFNDVNERAEVESYDPCLELVAEDLADDNAYMGRCLHCQREIHAKGGVEWRSTVRSPCPHCGRAGC